MVKVRGKFDRKSNYIFLKEALSYFLLFSFLVSGYITDL